MTQRRVALGRILARQFVVAASLPLLLVVVLWSATALPDVVQRIERENEATASLMRGQVEAVLSVPQRALEMAAGLIATSAPGSELTRTVLQQALATTPAFASVYVANARGIVEDAAVTANGGINASDLLALDLSSRPYYADARERRALVWSDTFLSPLTGQVTAVLALPVGDRLLIADFSLTGLASELTPRGRAHDAIVIVLDGKGRVIVHPQQRLAAWQENLGYLPLVRAALQGDPGAGEIEVDGQRWLATVAKARTTGWYILVAQPRSELFAPLRRIGLIVGAAVILAFALAVGMALRLARNEVRRYRRLVTAATNFVDQRDQHLEVDLGSEEVHELWRRLRSLLDQLHNETQQASAARRDLLAVLDAATEVSIISTDVDGVIRLFNRGAEKMLGYSAGALVGKATAQTLHDAAELAARSDDLRRRCGRMVAGFDVLAAIAREAGYEVRNWTYIRHDGSRLLVSIAMTAVHDARGELTGFLAIAVDQTQQQRAAELEVSRERAEAASEAKSEFLSRVSHELRTPLNAMLGYAQLLTVGSPQSLSDLQRDRVVRIETAGWHLVRLIDDLLDLSSIESSRIQLKMEAVDVVSVIAEAARLVEPRAAAQGVSVRQLVEPDASRPTPAVLGDHTRLKQVFVNLLSNAVKYNTRRGRVEVAFTQPDDKHLCIRITDTGRGMTAAQLQRLFTPFDRLGLETSGIDGTGIGLVITKRLVELMHGRIVVQSQSHEGTTILVTLPLAGGDHASPAAVSADEAAHGARVDGNVVYIEDNAVNALLMQEVFALRPRCRLHLASTLEEGRALIERLRPSLVLADMHLPDGTGLALLKWRHTNPFARATPVIIVSADATHTQQRLALEAGARAYLTKPFNLTEALQIIDEALASHATASRP